MHENNKLLLYLLRKIIIKLMLRVIQGSYSYIPQNCYIGRIYSPVKRKIVETWSFLPVIQANGKICLSQFSVNYIHATGATG